MTATTIQALGQGHGHDGTQIKAALAEFHHESLHKTSRVVLFGLWIDAALVMAASAWNGGRAVATLGDPFWWGVLLGGAVDIGLAMALIGDRALHLHGRVEPWGRTVRVTTALMSLGLNCAVALSEGRLGLAVFHAFLPVLLILLSEYQQSSTMQFNAIATEQEAAAIAEQEAQRATNQAAVDQAAENARLRTEVQQRDHDMTRLRADLERQTTATQAAKDQLATAQAVQAQPAKSRPAPAVKPTRAPSADRETRRQWVRAERAAGRKPSGADVDKRFGPPRNGAAVVKEVLAEEKQRLHVVGGKR